MAVREHLPEAVIVFERLHVVKLLYEKLTDVRRELLHQATNDLHKQVLKGTRWLLLKNAENLDPAAATLQSALREKLST